MGIEALDAPCWRITDLHGVDLNPHDIGTEHFDDPGDGWDELHRLAAAGLFDTLGKVSRFDEPCWVLRCDGCQRPCINPHTDLEEHYPSKEGALGTVAKAAGPPDRDDQEPAPGTVAKALADAGLDRDPVPGWRPGPDGTVWCPACPRPAADVVPVPGQTALGVEA